MHGALAWRLRGAGQLDRAEEEARVALALDSLVSDGHYILAEVYLRRGDYASANAIGGDMTAEWVIVGPDGSVRTRPRSWTR